MSEESESEENEGPGFPKGSKVYGARGEVFVYIAYLGPRAIEPGDTHLVRAVLVEEPDGEMHLGDPRVVYEVHEAPPVALRTQREETIERLDKEILERRGELDRLNGECNEIREIPRKLAAMGRLVPAVGRVLDFIEGRISHVVTVHKSGCRVEITPFADLRAREGYGLEKLRMLALMGRPPNGDGGNALRWEVNQYADGSGGWSECYPATSEDEARSLALAAFERFWAAPETITLAGVKCAEEIGIPVPRRVHVALAQAQIEFNQLQAAMHRARLQKSEDAIQTWQNIRDANEPASESP